MKNYDDIQQWLADLAAHAASAPEGACSAPLPDGKYRRFKLEDVDPAAIREFMARHGLQNCRDWGHEVWLFENPSICVLDFDYPFLKKWEECESLAEQWQNQPKITAQAKHRLIWRDKRVVPDAPPVVGFEPLLNLPV